MLSIHARRCLRVLLQGGYYQVRRTWNPLPDETVQYVALRTNQGEIVPGGATSWLEIYEAGLVQRIGDTQIGRDYLTKSGLMHNFTALEKCTIPWCEGTITYRATPKRPS